MSTETPRAPCTVDSHAAEVAALLAPLATALRDRVPEELDTDHPAAVGRVIAGPLSARTPIPAFDNSQMDGYAVLASDVAPASASTPVHLMIGVATAAGDPPTAHAPGTASPVMTGAPIPVGADAVIPVEEGLPPRFPRLFRANETPERATVAFAVPPAVGRFVRRRGEDTATGDRLAEAGTRITPTLLGALAAAGIGRIPVRPRLRILLCSTGDELGGPAMPLSPGRIHDANTPMMRAELERLGARVAVLRSGDCALRFRDDVRTGAAGADLVITTGGISQGAYEVVREALAPEGVNFHSVAMQPGGPQGLGTIRPEGDAAGLVPVLSFPGNPVSAALSLEVFLSPVLRLLGGLPQRRGVHRRPLAHDVDSPAAKHQIRRGTLDTDGNVVVSAPGSHLLGELAAARLLVHFPVGVSHAPAGSLVETWRFND